MSFAGGDKRKPKDFPAEKLDAPRDAEKGEGVPSRIQEAVKKGLKKAKASKKG